MVRICLLTIIIACLCACVSTEAPPPETAARDGMFIHITAGIDNPHRVAMALNMATIMSEDKDVILYFDIKGIEVVLKDSPDITYAQFPGSKAQLAALAEKGITIMACPGCLKAAGKTARRVSKASVVIGVRPSPSRH